MVVPDAARVGVAPEYTGTAPSATDSVCSTVPSQFLNVMVYVFAPGVAVFTVTWANTAVYDAFPDTAASVGAQ